MAKVNKQRRWPISLAIIIIVIAASIVLALTYRVPPGKLSFQAISDGAGGAIIAWQDGQSINAQKIGSNGEPLWTAGGALVCEKPMLPKLFAFSGDGLGGAIITWDDRANLSDDHEDPAYWTPIPVYSQRIDADGEPLWGEGILTGTTQRYGEHMPQVVPDGTGGAIIAWDDFQPVFRALHDDYLRLQKVDPAGHPMWGKEGVLVVSSSPFRAVTPEEKARGIKGTMTRSRPTYRGYHEVVSDSSGGVIVFWAEEAGSREYRIYAQRVDNDGEFVWQDKGILVRSTDYYYVSAVSDGASGAIFATRNDELDTTNVQRIGATGNLLWPDIGISIWKEYSPQMISDGLGGAFLIQREDQPHYGDPRDRQISLYAQRLDHEGEDLWLEKPIFTTEKGQFDLESAIAGDNSGGALITWRTWKKEPMLGGKVFVQKLDANGIPLWPAEGIAVFNRPDLKFQGAPQVVSDGSGGAIVIAAVGENALRGDMIYVQRLDANGNHLWGSGIRIDR